MTPVRGGTRVVGPTLVVLTLGALALAARGQPASSQPGPPFPTVPGRLLAASTEGCALSFAEQLKSVKAFAEMLPVFRHPRCRNCHGALDVLSDRHPGASQLEDATPDPRGLMNPEQRDSVSSQQCLDCHDNIRRMNHPSGKGGWMIPPKAMFFVAEDGSDKSDEDLCRQMKRMEPTGKGFVSHIRDDHETIQFIEAGFAGDRALGEQGLNDNGLEAEAPPGSREELTEQARKWVEDLGDGYESSHDCGCVVPNLELTMKSDLKGIAQGQTMTAQVTATVRLERDSSGTMYHGRAPLAHGIYTLPPLPPGCRATFAPTGGELDVKEVRFDVPDDGPMTIDLAVQPTNSGGNVTMTCPRIRAMVMPVIPFAQEWRFVHETDRRDLHYLFGEFEMAAAGAGSERMLIGHKDVTREVEREGVTITTTTRFEVWTVPPE